MPVDETTSSQQSNRKLKLVLKTSPLSTPIEPATSIHPAPKDGSSSPPRPSYSPVTPTGTHEHRATTQEQSAPQWIDEPPPLSLNLDENADAIALRATISLLQMQRQQSLRDIRQLDKIRDAALSDPRGFADELQAGKLNKPMAADIVLDDVEFDEEDDNDDTTSKNTDKTTKFEPLPNPQNIARCPPIEWSKYHIVGRPLEDMHNSQKRHPGSNGLSNTRKVTAHDQELTAPYRLFTDKVTNQNKSKR